MLGLEPPRQRQWLFRRGATDCLKLLDDAQALAIELQEHAPGDPPPAVGANWERAGIFNVGGVKVRSRLVWSSRVDGNTDIVQGVALVEAPLLFLLRLEKGSVLLASGGLGSNRVARKRSIDRVSRRPDACTDLVGQVERTWRLLGTVIIAAHVERLARARTPVVWPEWSGRSLKVVLLFIDYGKTLSAIGGKLSGKRGENAPLEPFAGRRLRCLVHQAVALRDPCTSIVR